MTTTAHHPKKYVLKSSRNKKDVNDVTAAIFWVSFSQLPAAKKTPKNGAAVTSLRSFLFCDDFIKHSIWGFCLKYYYFLVIGSFRGAATDCAAHCWIYPEGIWGTVWIHIGILRDLSPCLFKESERPRPHTVQRKCSSKHSGLSNRP